MFPLIKKRFALSIPEELKFKRLKERTGFVSKFRCAIREKAVFSPAAGKKDDKVGLLK